MIYRPSLADKLRETLRVMSVRKVLNLAVGMLELACKRARLRCLPSRISIETGNICNLQCPLCPTGRRETDTVRGFIDFDHYCKIIDELRHTLILVRLYNWGEPLLHKQLLDMIRYAHSRGIGVTISTNLNILDAETARLLMGSGLQKIFVSCDGISDQTYRAYHVGGDLQTVLGNMRLLVAQRAQQAHCRTRIIWLFHVFRHNEHEIEEARRMAAEMGVEIRINPMRTDMGKEIFETAAQAIDRDRAWIPEDPRYCAFDLETRESKIKRDFCSLPWKETVVNWNGNLLPCCSVYQDTYSFGNAFAAPFKQVWNSPAYEAARRELANRANAQKTVCHICKATGFTHF